MPLLCRSRAAAATALGLIASIIVLACGAGEDSTFDTTAQDFGGRDGGPGVFGDGAANSDPGLPPGETRDPIDCEEAKTSKSYVGCDYWPTITPNSVWSLFDFAAVVANTSDKDVTVTISGGPSRVNKKVTVPAGQLRKIELPWVPALKGADHDECGNPPGNHASALVAGGAYHLVSSAPVIVYQFNALQYKGEGGNPSGGPKDWSACIGSTKPCRLTPIGPSVLMGCFSYTNDASLLLPSTAMTGNYRVIGMHGASVKAFLAKQVGVTPAVLTITATAAHTHVTVSLAGTAKVIASTSGSSNTAVPATNAGGKVTMDLDAAGDVLQLVGGSGSAFDFSGSLVQSDKPVQVIASVPCINLPQGKVACDHIEESVMPAETLGKHYVVAPPTGPKGAAVAQMVRLYGNKDDTTLTYSPSKPAKCPARLNAGQVADCDLVSEAFEVTGDNEFGVATFLLGAEVYDDTKGDPDQSTHAAVEQFRTKYVFLAPKDYPVLFADITATEDAAIEFDGAPLPPAATGSTKWARIGAGPFGVHRVDLTKSGQDGAHTLTAKKPVGVQVIGFGDYTSFQYPAGLNLKLIAPPPPPPAGPK